jgi:hypothetical protein
VKPYKNYFFPAHYTSFLHACSIIPVGGNTCAVAPIYILNSYLIPVLNRKREGLNIN